MKWSLVVGKIWGTEIRLHASLALIVPYVLIAFRPEDLSGALRVLLLVVAVFACVALHEVGHSIAARLYGIQVNSIVLWPLGGFANLSRHPDKVLHEMVISAAGPLTNLLIFSGLLVLVVFEQLMEQSLTPPGILHVLSTLRAFPFLSVLAISNLALAVFNLIPVYPLDGGQITRGLLKLIVGEQWADRIMLMISLPLALALAIYGIVSGDLIIALTGFMMLLAGSTLNVRLFNGLVLIALYFIDRGEYYLRRMDFDPALREFTRAIENAPTRSGLYVSRAIVYMNLLEHDRAKADIQRALELDEHNFVAWTLFGELLGQENAYPEALAAFDRAIEIRPNWGIIYLDRGTLYMEQARYGNALDDFNLSIELTHGSAIHHLHRSMLFFRIGKLENAHTDEDLALHYAPHWMLVFPDVFQTTLEGHLDWALDYYWRAIERMPNAYQAYQGRADACRANYRYDWAIADYDRAIRMSPRQSELYMARGRCFLQMGYGKQAAADFKRARQYANRSHLRRQADRLLAQAQTGAPV